VKANPTALRNIFFVHDLLVVMESINLSKETVRQLLNYMSLQDLSTMAQVNIVDDREVCETRDPEERRETFRHFYELYGGLAGVLTQSNFGSLLKMPTIELKPTTPSLPHPDANQIDVLLETIHLDPELDLIDRFIREVLQPPFLYTDSMRSTRNEVTRFEYKNDQVRRFARRRNAKCHLGQAGGSFADNYSKLIARITMIFPSQQSNKKEIEALSKYIFMSRLEGNPEQRPIGLREVFPPIPNKVGTCVPVSIIMVLLNSISCEDLCLTSTPGPKVFELPYMSSVNFEDVTNPFPISDFKVFPYFKFTQPLIETSCNNGSIFYVRASSPPAKHSQVAPTPIPNPNTIIIPHEISLQTFYDFLVSDILMQRSNNIRVTDPNPQTDKDLNLKKLLWQMYYRVSDFIYADYKSQYYHRLDYLYHCLNSILVHVGYEKTAYYGGAVPSNFILSLKQSIPQWFEDTEIYNVNEIHKSFDIPPKKLIIIHKHKVLGLGEDNPTKLSIKSNNVTYHLSGLCLCNYNMINMKHIIGQHGFFSGHALPIIKHGNDFFSDELIGKINFYEKYDYVHKHFRELKFNLHKSHRVALYVRDGDKTSCPSQKCTIVPSWNKVFFNERLGQSYTEK